jgi:hypothetical protein
VCRIAFQEVEWQHGFVIWDIAWFLLLLESFVFGIFSQPFYVKSGSVMMWFDMKMKK